MVTGRTRLNLYFKTSLLFPGGVRQSCSMSFVFHGAGLVAVTVTAIVFGFWLSVAALFVLRIPLTDGKSWS